MRFIQALLLAFILVLPTIDSAEARCLSRKEARAAWPHEYLKWRTAGRHRCWYLPHKVSKQIADKPEPDTTDTKRPLLITINEMEATKPIEQLEPFVSGVMEILKEAEETTTPNQHPTFDEIWADISPKKTRSLSYTESTESDDDGVPSGTVVFSTFLGEPPDVWPELPSDPTPWRIALVMAIFSMMGLWTWRVLTR